MTEKNIFDFTCDGEWQSKAKPETGRKKTHQTKISEATEAPQNLKIRGLLQSQKNKN
jgi:hypothetical protein